MADVPAVPNQDEELRRLREFLWQLQGLLDAIVKRPENIIPGRHHELLRAAWVEIRPRFESIELTSNNRPDLVAVGLSGAALLFELSIFSHARGDLIDHAPQLFAVPTTSPAPTLEKPRGWWARLRRLCHRTLKAGDVVLGSLGKIPVFGLPAEGIKQFKESVEEGVALANEVVRS
jgi:hypothetical protein